MGVLLKICTFPSYTSFNWDEIHAQKDVRRIFENAIMTYETISDNNWPYCSISNRQCQKTNHPFDEPFGWNAAGRFILFWASRGYNVMQVTVRADTYKIGTAFPSYMKPVFM